MIVSGRCPEPHFILCHCCKERSKKDLDKTNPPRLAAPAIAFCRAHARCFEKRLSNHLRSALI